MEVIKSIDFVGSPIQFRFKSSEKFKSVYGGLLTMILIFMVSIFSVPLIQGLMAFVSPSVVKSFGFDPTAFLNLTHDFPLMMTVAQRGNIYFDDPDSYYTISAFAYHGYYALNGTEKFLKLDLTKMDMHKCSNDTIRNDFGEHTNLFLKSFTAPDLSYGYCFPMGQNLSYIFGFLGERPLQYLAITIDICDNSTSKVPCKSIDQIKKTLSGAILLMSYPDYYLDHDNREPATFFLNTKAFPISASFYKRYYDIY